MAKKYVPVFFDWKDTTVDLDQAQKGNLIDAIVDYASEQRTDEEILSSLTAIERVAFRFMRGQVDRNEEISAVRSRAGSSKAEQNATNESKQKQEKTKDSKKGDEKRFIPPTIEEVRAYCKERGNNVDPEHFVAYNENRNWTLSNGKKMKDWKLAVITWEKNNFSKPQALQFEKKVNAQKYEQRDYHGAQETPEEMMERLMGGGGYGK